MLSPSVPGPAASNLIACKTVTPLTLDSSPRFGLAQAQPEDYLQLQTHLGGANLLCISIWNGLHSHSGPLHITGPSFPLAFVLNSYTRHPSAYHLRVEATPTCPRHEH
jgi:hypothetical protein